MKKIIHTTKAPSAIGTYNQAVQSNGFIFTSGQLGIDPDNGKLVSGGIGSETLRALENIESILKQAGVDKIHILKLTVFLTDLDGFDYVNDSFKKFFDGSDFPARSTVEVSALPMSAKVEIECVAYLIE
ncbi:MAG: reactive intermediate/imine deaminase [Candidatus Marinimicrobia bacterium]|nr:reactive intermediate/imine deaminase [Candidatus Neomarinimicrobiota bacterium]|tara:strand:+ start:211 stop:597 length:387 start_codon:yes stop_codon:yes gene_type:complete